MLTDLHLQKYLQGLLSEEESREVEKMLEKSPDLQARLEVLENQSQVLGKPMWQRVLLEKKSRLGSRTRYTTILPALLLLVLVLMVAGHWFSKPGENSTFTMTGGNGTSLELLYDSPTGWRYLDAALKAEDSLTFSVRDTAAYYVSVLAVYGPGPEGVVPVWSDDAHVFRKATPKPVFGLDTRAHPGLPRQFLVFYDRRPLPTLPGHLVMELLSSQGVERGGVDFQYQVFSAGR